MVETAPTFDPAWCRVHSGFRVRCECRHEAGCAALDATDRLHVAVPPFIRAQTVGVKIRKV